MAKRKSARLAVLNLSDAIMTLTVPAHEALCDEEKCNLDNSCIFCQINAVLEQALSEY